MRRPQSFTINASCPGEAAAGLRSWEETFTITLEFGGWDDETIQALIDAFSQDIREILDARYVNATKP